MAEAGGKADAEMLGLNLKWFRKKGLGDASGEAEHLAGSQAV